MIGSFLIAMLNPMLATLFASIFLLLWHLRGGRAYIAEFALGYYAYGAAFLLQAVREPFGDPGNALLSHLLFTIAFFSIIHGILARLGRPAPFGALAVLTLCGFAGLLWFIFVHPDMSGRIFSVNFMYGGMLLVAAAELRGVPGKARIDRALFAILLLAGLYCFVRSSPSRSWKATSSTARTTTIR